MVKCKVFQIGSTVGVDNGGIENKVCYNYDVPVEPNCTTSWNYHDKKWGWTNDPTLSLHCIEPKSVKGKSFGYSMSRIILSFNIVENKKAISHVP